MRIDYQLDMAVFWQLPGGRVLGDGDYTWQLHELFNDDEEPRRWVYQRDHVPSGSVSWWICASYDRDWAIMVPVVKVPVLTHEWQIVGTPVGGSSSWISPA